MKEFILCCVSSTEMNENFLNDIRALLSLNEGKIEKEVKFNEHGLYATELFIHIKDTTSIKINLMDLSNRHQIDLAFIPRHHRGKGKLIVFDMDSTLIQHEVIDEMAMVHGIGHQVKLITERAMNGELDFNGALRERVALLKGLSRESMEEILGRLKLSPGVETLISELRKRGYKTAILSGGFKFFAESFRKRLQMDYAFANELEMEDGLLTGQLKGAIINAEEKARLLEEIAEKEGISLEDSIAVGDGANDLLMLAKAGFGIAYHAKEKVRKEAKYQMNHNPMTTILFFLGLAGDA